MSRLSKLIPLFACIALLATLAQAQIDNPAEEVVYTHNLLIVPVYAHLLVSLFSLRMPRSL